MIKTFIIGFFIYFIAIIIPFVVLICREIRKYKMEEDEEKKKEEEKGNEKEE